MRARLIVEYGIASPPTFDLNDDLVTYLGRNRENSVVLQDRHASRWHAKIFARQGRWFLVDQNTTNGTRLDGEPVSSETPLVDGQRIDIGDTRLRFAIDPSKETTDQMPALGTAPAVPSLPREPYPVPLAGADLHPTLLHPDELTALVRFMNESLKVGTADRLVTLALETIQRQTGAELSGFLGQDGDNPDFIIVVPAQATVDRRLSTNLTQKVLREGTSVWLGARRGGHDVNSESLSHFCDAICIPLRVGQVRADTDPDSCAEADSISLPDGPLGTLHVYKSRRLFNEREVCFCEVLAGSLASALHVLRVRRALEADNSRLRVRAASYGEELIGSSPAMKQLRQQVSRLANGPANILILGESGVGKELVALGLHGQSSRRGGPLVPVNCAGITATLPESELFGHVRGAFTGAIRDHTGFFVQAAMGTLFLDEIGELSPEIQARLLRAIETKSIRPVGGRSEVKVDVRIIAATNRDLERDGRFRKDLFYRFTTRIEVPPLRDHAQDIPELVDYFLARLAVEYRRQMKLSDAALQRLKAYSWPGNVRQLRSVLETAVANASGNTREIQPGDLLLDGSAGRSDLPASLNLNDLEIWAIRQALAQTGGNNTQAARLLGIHRDTLITKLKKYAGEQPS
jgi:Nif-specific regulatory protein